MIFYPIFDFSIQNYNRTYFVKIIYHTNIEYFKLIYSIPNFDKGHKSINNLI